MTRVSIVIPCYNGGSMVADAVTSALAQTHPDAEVVVVNDGSTDPATLATLNDIESTGNARVVHQTNQGVCGALNRAVEESTGEYILPLAHDDEFYPSYAAKAAAVLDSDQAAGIVYSKAERFGAATGEWHLPDPTIDHMLISNAIHACSMYRRADWDTVGGYDNELRRGYEDWDFWLKILGLGRTVVRLDEILFRYRLTEGSLSSAMSQQVRTDAFARIFANNVGLYTQHADTFAELVVSRQEQNWDLLDHFKRRYGRVEDVVSRVGALRRRIRT